MDGVIHDGVSHEGMIGSMTSVDASSCRLHIAPFYTLLRHLPQGRIGWQQYTSASSFTRPKCTNDLTTKSSSMICGEISLHSNSDSSVPRVAWLMADLACLSHILFSMALKTAE